MVPGSLTGSPIAPNRPAGFAPWVPWARRAAVLLAWCGVALLAPWPLAGGEGATDPPERVLPGGIETVAGFSALGDGAPVLEARWKAPVGMAGMPRGISVSPAARTTACGWSPARAS